MKRALLLTLTIVFLQSIAFTQSQTGSSTLCPAISTESVPEVAIPGEKIHFKVKFGNNFDTSKLKFIWTVSSGKILKGKETKSILVEQTLNASTTVVSTVEILGFPKICPSTFSQSPAPHDPPRAMVFDAFSEINIEEENERLNALSDTLKAGLAQPYLSENHLLTQLLNQLYIKIYGES